MRYLIKALIWVFTIVPKCSQLAEILAVLALLDIESGAFALDVHDLLCLKGCHLLLYHDAQLLRISPLVWQSLAIKY
jgi:hypothetical protein